jgi:hypothetical protein
LAEVIPITESFLAGQLVVFVFAASLFLLGVGVGF